MTSNFLFSCIVIHPSSRSIAINLYHLNFLNLCTCRTSLHFIVLALSDRQTVPQGGCSSVRHSKSYSFRSKQVYLYRRPISVSLCSLYSKSLLPTSKLSKLSFASSRVAILLSDAFFLLIFLILIHLCCSFSSFHLLHCLLLLLFLPFLLQPFASFPSSVTFPPSKPSFSL